MITITNIAKTKLNELLTNNLGKALFLYIKGGGCHGFSFKFKVLSDDKKPSKNDEIIKVNNHNLYVCGRSLLHIIGTKVDYIEDIMGSRFDFSNEKIESKCGCGTSVNFK